MTIEEMIKDADLEPKTINKVVKDFQKAGEKYNGMQCAVTLKTATGNPYFAVPKETIPNKLTKA